jgi:hypothetical protein
MYAIDAAGDGIVGIRFDQDPFVHFVLCPVSVLHDEVRLRQLQDILRIQSDHIVFLLHFFSSFRAPVSAL